MILTTLHPKSSEAQILQLDLFAVPPTQMSLKSGRYISYTVLDQSKKNNGISGGGTIVFNLGESNNYRDFNDCHLHLQARILNAYGT